MNEIERARQMMNDYINALSRLDRIVAQAEQSGALSGTQLAAARSALAAARADVAAQDRAFRAALAANDGAEALRIAQGRWEVMRAALAAASAITSRLPLGARLLDAVTRAARGAGDAAREALDLLARGTGAGFGGVLIVAAVLLFFMFKK
jgi:hypothetical protein